MPSARGAENREVVRFRASASEHDVAIGGAEQVRSLATRLVEPLPRPLAFLMDTGSVAEILGRYRQQRLEYFVKYRRCSVVIKVETRHRE
jgi:hypothetical protein